MSTSRDLQARLDNASRWGSWVRPSAHAPLRAEHWHPRHASLVRNTRETLCGGRDSVTGIPWGNALTALPTLSDAQRASVNASLAVLVDRLGLTAVGEPGVKLVTKASGG